MEVTEFAQLISGWFFLIAVICFIGLVVLMLLELYEKAKRGWDFVG